MAEFTIEELVRTLGLEAVSGHKGLKRLIKGAYCGDLLSDVMANSKEGDLWITIQTHQNIVAVAVLREHAGIVLASNRTPDPETMKKSESEGIPILRSPMNSFILSGVIYELLKA